MVAIAAVRGTMFSTGRTLGRVDQSFMSHQQVTVMVLAMEHWQGTERLTCGRTTWSKCHMRRAFLWYLLSYISIREWPGGEARGGYSTGAEMALEML